MVDERVGDLLKHVHWGLRKRLDARLGALGLTASQNTVLLALGRGPRISGMQLANACLVSPQAINQIVRSLEDLELIGRRPSGEHPRALALELTEKGRALLAKARQVAALAESEMVAGILQKDRRTFINCLVQCAANLEAIDFE